MIVLYQFEFSYEVYKSIMYDVDNVIARVILAKRYVNMNINLVF
jgi:hypothetical protein